jgi:hypothetical protein
MKIGYIQTVRRINIPLSQIQFLLVIKRKTRKNELQQIILYFFFFFLFVTLFYFYSTFFAVPNNVFVRTLAQKEAFNHYYLSKSDYLKKLNLDIGLGIQYTASKTSNSSSSSTTNPNRYACMLCFITKITAHA